MIRPERLTIKAQEAFRDAGELARRRGNPVVNDAHLLAALLAQAEGVVQPLLQKAGLNVTALRQAVEREIDRFPTQEGGARSRPSAASCSGSSTAPTPRPRSWATPTSRPSTCCSRWPRRRAPPLRALLSAQNVSADDLRARARGGARLAPGHRPVARGEVPGAGALHPEPHRAGPARESSIRSSAGTRRSAASCRCCPAAPRTTRC